MSEPVGLQLVVATWIVLGVYVYWDLARVRAHARRELADLLLRLSDVSEHARKAIIRKHLDKQASAYREFRELPLWRRWSESMGRVHNLVFGMFLGTPALTTLAWWGEESVRLWLNWCIALAVIVASLASVAVALRKVF